MTMPIFQKIKIKDHCEITSSKRIFANEYLASGVPFYRGKEISEKQKSFSEVSNLIYISKKKFDEIKSKYGAPQEGDLLLTSVGTIGNPYLVKKNEEFYFKDGNLTWFRNFKGIDSKWLYYWLLSPQGKSELNKCTIGSSQKAYTINLLYGLQLDLPDINIQTKIASVFFCYDNLIENNEKRIKTLEEMAQLLYTEWFVKFKYPGHDKVKMVDSETKYGMIPEGWEVKKIGELLTTVKRKTKLRTSEYQLVGKYPVVDQGADFIAGYTNNPKTVYNENLIVFGDHSRCYKYCNFEFACGADGTQLLKTNDENRVPQSLLYYLVINSGLQSYSYTRHFKFLKEIKVLISDIITSQKFDKFVGQNYEQIQKLKLQNNNLSKIRDLLIPQLVTGKREIKQSNEN